MSDRTDMSGDVIKDLAEGQQDLADNQYELWPERLDDFTKHLIEQKLRDRHANQDRFDDEDDFPCLPIDFPDLSAEPDLT